MNDVTPKQKILSNRLKQYDDDIKIAYPGSIHTLNSKEYPERLVHFAHSLREVIYLLIKKSLSVKELRNQIDDKTKIRLLKMTIDSMGHSQL